jgi:Family of unknown function (DUF6152)
MRRRTIPLMGALAGLLLAGGPPVLAHHSVNAEFNMQAPVTFKGVVTKLDWMNPHSWIYVDAKDDSGAITKWQCETGAPVELVRRGWRKDSLKEGQEVTITGFRAKDGTNTCTARGVVLPDGTQVFSGSSTDGGPQAVPPGRGKQ